MTNRSPSMLSGRLTVWGSCKWKNKTGWVKYFTAGAAWSSPEGLEGFVQVENGEGLPGGGKSPGRERE